jgi:hypothetical protein
MAADFVPILLFGMTTPAPPQSTGSPDQSRIAGCLFIMLTYVVVIGICPYFIFTLAVDAVTHLSSQDEYKWQWLALLVGLLGTLYVSPAEAVLGRLIPWGSDPSFLPGGLAGAAKVVLFYSMVGLGAAGVHIWLLRGKREAEPGAAPNGGPAPPPSNSEVTHGPPSVS